MRGVTDLAMASGAPPAASASRDDLPDPTTQRKPKKKWPVFRWLIRAGFVSRGITYGIIGILAMSLALRAGTMPASDDQQGAMVLLARTPLGHAGLILVALGLLAYAIWKFMHGFVERGPEGAVSGGLKDRIANFGGGAVYIAFFVVTVKAIAGAAGNEARSQRHAAAGVLGWPGGPELIGIVGLTLGIVSLFQVYEAVVGKFAEECRIDHLDNGHCRMFMIFGRVGLVARGAVFALVGYFVVRTAIEYQPSNAVGLSGALVKVAKQPLGGWLVSLAAVGLLVFAFFSLAEARYRKL